jgi:hypothetical protein
MFRADSCVIRPRMRLPTHTMTSTMLVRAPSHLLSYATLNTQQFVATRVMFFSGLRFGGHDDRVQYHQIISYFVCHGRQVHITF